MKLVSYPQPICLCVKIEQPICLCVVVGTILLSCELYSLLWSCFRSCRIDTIVYGKWYFVLHVQSGPALVGIVCIVY